MLNREICLNEMDHTSVEVFVMIVASITETAPTFFRGGVDVLDQDIQTSEEVR